MAARWALRASTWEEHTWVLQGEHQEGQRRTQWDCVGVGGVKRPSERREDLKWALNSDRDWMGGEEGEQPR